MIIRITDLQKLKNFISLEKLTVIYFYADWCFPCKRVAPFINKISEDTKYSNIIFLKIDVDVAEDIIELYNIQSMPTFIFLKNGEEVYRFSGVLENKLLEIIEQLK